MDNNEILNLVFKSGGEVFGGYLRDTIAGLEPNDIDVSFSKPEAMKNFVSALSKECFVKVEEKKGEYAYGFLHWRLHVQGLQVSHIDLVQYGDQQHEDVDVNLLVMTGKDRLFCRYPGNLFQVLKHIQNREFSVLSNHKPERIEKLLARGWKQV